VTFEHTSYAVKEDDIFAVLTILLDQPSCVNVTVVVVPQEKLPVDASSESYISFSLCLYSCTKH